MSYSPIYQILELFNSPETLNELPQILAHTNQYKSELNTSIANDIDKYNNSYTDLKPETAQLIESIRKIKNDSQKTQSSISSMTSSIQSLDSYKKNLVLTMTIIKRLQMLINANNTLISIIPSHKYHDILQLLSVIKQLLVYFKPYRSIDEINSINLMIVNTQNKLVDDIFNDFEELNLERIDGGDSRTSLDSRNSQNDRQAQVTGASNATNGNLLLYGCEILYLIDPKYKDKLLNMFYNNQLKDIKMIFNISEEAGSLENLSRRFIYFKNTLNTVQSKYAKIFPADWKIDLELSKIFCKITNQDIMDLLRRSNDKVDSKSLMENLLISLEFEKTLNDRFQSDEFNQIISKAFEPYLKVYIKEQERFFSTKIMEYLSISQIPDELIGDKDQEDFLNKLKVNNVPNIANSSIELFKSLNKILNQITRISNGEVLLDLARLFNDVLADYHNRILLPILPRSDEDLQGSGGSKIEAIKYLTMLLNTGDYVINNISELQDNLVAQVMPKYKNQISFEYTKDIFYKLINKSVSNLLIKISLDLKVSWRQFENVNWSKTSDETTTNEEKTVSSYMVELKNILIQDLRIISPLIIRDSYVRNFNDKLIEMLVNLFGNHLRFVTPLNLNNVEQLQKDLSSLKSLGIDFPLFSDPNYDTEHSDNENVKIDSNDSKKQKVSKSYQNLVLREFNSLESILRVVSTPALPLDDLIESYFEQIGDRSISNLCKVLALKGIERQDQKKYIENFKLQLRVDNSNLMEQSTLLSNIEGDEDERARFVQSTSTNGSEIKSPRLLPGPINNFEKNLREFALNGENHVNKLNENFKNFGKFFRKDFD